MMLRSRHLFVLATAVACASGAWAGPTAVDVVCDLIVAAPQARVSDCVEFAPRASASAGGVQQPALFEHPATPARPARAEYDLDLPPVARGERLILAFSVALSDGVRFDVPGIIVDGVCFQVEVEGKLLYSADWRQIRWRPGGVDLTPFAGRHVRLALLVGANQTVNYDWALWGSPRVLLFHGTGDAGPRFGSLAVAYQPGADLRVHIRPVGKGAPISWQAPEAKEDAEPADAPTRWATFELSYPEATAVQVEVEPRSAVVGGTVWLAAYQPRLRLVRVGPTRAVPLAGTPCPLGVEVRNEGRGLLEAGTVKVAGAVGGAGLPALGVPALSPGGTWRGEWPWSAPRRPGAQRCRARLLDGSEAGLVKCAFTTFPAPTEANTLVLGDRRLRLEFVRDGGGYAYCRLLASGAGGPTRAWEPVAVWYPLARVVADSRQGPWSCDLRFASARGTGSTLALDGTAVDPDGVTWRVNLSVTLDPDRPLAFVQVAYSANQARLLRAAWGLNLYVGDGTTGDAKYWALYPGVDHLYAGEASSSLRDLSPAVADRRTPDPRKVTLPIMAVTVGPGAPAPPASAARFWCPDSQKDWPPPPDAAEAAMTTVALAWDPLRRWDGQHALPSSTFASPNLSEGMHNHRLGLFVPSVPENVPENADRADKSYPLAADQELSLEASVLVQPGPVLGAVREWYRTRLRPLPVAGGVPTPKPWPRGFQEELTVCRQGLLKTVWDETTQKWVHCIGYKPYHSPGLAALVWLDSHLCANPSGRAASAERVNLVSANMLRDGGPGAFIAPTNTHILRWEFPFLYGCLPEALPALDAEMAGYAASQRPGGGWGFQPGAPEQADLGEHGDSVLGTSAYNTYLLARYARITGNGPALAAAQKALAFMEQFRVPRGAGTWECPMYEPDLLAAGNAVGAYVEGYRATGDRRWLQDAVYWAESGLPFIYQWSLPDRPMMLGATTSNIGSTFYYHSWIGMPVQWVGLVYAFHVQRLARALEGAGDLTCAASPLRPVVDLAPDEWRRVAELITVSGMNQQFADGDRVGTYPDSITDLSKRNEPSLNPEDILVNVLALRGQDLDVHTARIAVGRGQVIVSSGARVEGLRQEGGRLRFRLRGFPGAVSHTLVVGFKADRIQAGGQDLPPFSSPMRTEPGWSWDAGRGRLFLNLAHPAEVVDVVVSGAALP